MAEVMHEPDADGQPISPAAPPGGSRSSKSTRDAFRRDTFALPRAQAREKARELFQRFPKAAYQTEIESWRELPGDRIEFTMRRLPSAD